MKRLLTLTAAVLAAPLALAPAAHAGTPQGDGNGTPTQVTTVHTPLSFYAEKDSPGQISYLLAGESDNQAFAMFSVSTFGADGSSSSSYATGTWPKQALHRGGNLSSASLDPVPITVTQTDCDPSGGCTSSTTTTTFDFTATATGPVVKQSGSDYSRKTSNGKYVIAGSSKVRTATVTAHLGDATWTATDDGFVTTMASLGDGSGAYVCRDEYC